MHSLAEVRAEKRLLEQVVSRAVDVWKTVAVYLDGIGTVVWSVGTVYPKGCSIEVERRRPVCRTVLLKGTQVITIRGSYYWSIDTTCKLTRQQSYRFGTFREAMSRHTRSEVIYHQ